jgi:hypothetical protein
MAIGATAFALFGGSCGYRLGAARSVVGGARSVHVRPFDVDAREVGVAYFTRALREEVAARTGLRLASEARADLVIAGKLRGIDRAPFAFPTYAAGSAPRVGEWRAQVRAEVEVRRRADNVLLVRTGELTLSSEHMQGADVLGTEANRERALRQIAADLARRVAELVADAV